MYEVDFLPVGDGNGDAICIRYGSPQNGYYLNVVDGGFTDTADAVIRHIETYYGEGYLIDEMVLSHADNDHACGLIGILKRFDVRGALWMNRPWLYAQHVLPYFHGSYTLEGLIKEMRGRHPYLVTLEKMASERGIEIKAPLQGAQIGAFTVLAPSPARYVYLIPGFEKTPTAYRSVAAGILGGGGILSGVLEKARTWIDERWDYETLSNDPDPPTSDSNESCVVQLGLIDGRTLLLTADVGPEGLDEAADFAEGLGLLHPPNFVQMPHHGSRRNVTPYVLDRWLGPRRLDNAEVGTAFCSVGGGKDDYPRGQVKNAFLRRGYPVHLTRGQTKSHFHGTTLRPGWNASQPEPFATRVEG